ncbi:MAG: penicillin-binding protein 2 [Patescibacteria group bacterium]
MVWQKTTQRNASSGVRRELRSKVFWYLCFIFVLLVVVRLFYIQVINHGFYKSLASGQHEMFKELVPERGSIYIQDLKDNKLIPVAVNQQLAFVYADPRNIKDADYTASKLGDVLELSVPEVENLAQRFSDHEDPYEPVKKQVDDETLEKILALELPGIWYVREPSRYYPEQEIGGHVIGFMGANEQGYVSGKYGIEGYMNELLAGTPGSISSEKDIAGRIIAIGQRSIEPAVNGVDIVLTIDKTIQYVACSKLHEAVLTHQADGGSVVILEPNTGKVLAMCGEPDFNPNRYGEVESINAFNNPAIFAAYEPGSIFKTMTISAGIDSGAISPATTYEDTGSVTIGKYTINNSDELAHGIKTMTQALEESLNTGMIFAMRETTPRKFSNYIKDFGFGQKTGIMLETESQGNISSLEEASEIYAATASFGQGITVTPLQIANAYSAIANGGVLKKPYIIDEIRYPDGKIEKTSPTDIKRVIDSKTSNLVSAMLVSVIEHGHGKRAGVDGYYIGGKTGTAQVAKTDGLGYDENITIGSFAGFGPVEDPKFVMVVRIDRPRTVQWAESTAAPLFGEIAKFLLQYFEVAPTRNQ